MLPADIKIVGLGGASNPHRATMVALEAALAGARAAGAETVTLDIHALDLPMYRYGVDEPRVTPLIDAVRSAHGMIWCSPLYHGTVAGAFKNAIDWLELLHHDDPPYLSNKVIGLMATAGGEQALQAINTMEYIVRSLRGWTLSLTAPIERASRAFDDRGQARDDRLRERLHTMGQEMVRAARKLAARE